MKRRDNIDRMNDLMKEMESKKPSKSSPKIEEAIEEEEGGKKRKKKVVKKEE